MRRWKISKITCNALSHFKRVWEKGVQTGFAVEKDTILKNTTMEKVVRIVKKGADEANIIYWASRNSAACLEELESIRQVYIRTHNGSRQGLQRVYRIIKRA